MTIHPAITSTIGRCLKTYSRRFDDTLYRLEYNGTPLALDSHSEWATARGAKMALNSHLRCSLDRGWYGPEMEREETDKVVAELWSSGIVKIVEFKKVRV